MERDLLSFGGSDTYLHFAALIQVGSYRFRMELAMRPREVQPRSQEGQCGVFRVLFAHSVRKQMLTFLSETGPCPDLDSLVGGGHGKGRAFRRS